MKRARMEITAFLRPNPDLNVSLDQINLFTTNPYRPLAALLPFRVRQLSA